jgi:hypothetical protein
MDVVEFAPYVFQLLSQMIEIHPAALPPAYMSIFPALLVPLLWERQAGGVLRTSTKLSVGRTIVVRFINFHHLEIEGTFTQGSRSGRTVGESVGGMFEMDCSYGSNRLPYYKVDTKPDTEFIARGIDEPSPRVCLSIRPERSL